MSPGRDVRKPSTRWSLILAARLGGTPEAREALTSLCVLYWYPLYAFVRRRGCAAGQPLLSIDSEEAEGLYGRELSHELTPGELFERRWALALLEDGLLLLHD